MNLTKIMTLFAALFMTASPALAQSVKLGKAPQGQMWLYILIALFMTGLIVAGSFLWSKRGHHD
ncbi:hypothetical protein [Poriferisphaera corsica]|nr:hypothetical protein [Poriferisphaera corsica]